MVKTGRPTGRPPRVPGARVVKPTIRMTDEEWQMVCEAAELDGKTATSFARDYMIGAAFDLLEARRLARPDGDRRAVQVDVGIDRRGRTKDS